jgi:sugar lactone lactonase YvrE
LNPYGGVAFDGEGNLVVADSLNHRIQVFRYSDGTHLRSFGSNGAGAGQFNIPFGIAFDGAGHIIVSDYNNHRVQVLRYSDGAHVRTLGSQGSGNGQFSYAQGIAVDGEGNVAVFDNGNARVQVFRLSDGAYVRTIGSQGSGNGQFGVGYMGYGGVAFDSEGNLVVADSGNNRVQVLRYRDAHTSAPSVAKEREQVSSSVLLASRSMPPATLLSLSRTTIACKCFATATAPMFAPSAASAQATGGSTPLRRHRHRQRRAHGRG